MAVAREPRLKILIAEDQYLMREGTRRLLTEAGMDVVGDAGDYASVLAEARRLEPDVVLMDIKMPPTYSTEGIDAAHASRGSDRRPVSSSSPSTTTRATCGHSSPRVSPGTATCSSSVSATCLS